MKFFNLCAIGFAALLDIAVGAAIVAGLSQASGHPVGLPGLAMGAFLALLPDIDVVYMLLHRGRMYGSHHTWLTHRPFLMIPLAATVAWFLGGAFWAAAAFLAVFWHYVHDTPEFCGSGIAWFWPFTDQWWSPLRGFFAPHINDSDHGEFLRRWLGPTVPVEIEIIAAGIVAAYPWSYLYTLSAGITVGFLILLIPNVVWILHHVYGARAY